MVPLDADIHVLLVPYPAQGHLNPVLQFGKRLANHGGVRCTVAVTRFVARGSAKPSPCSSVHVALFSDGCDAEGPAALGGHQGPYFERLEAAGSAALDGLLRSEAELGRPVRVVVYDPFMPWVRALARRHGASCAAFLTQTCAVDIVYTHARAGRVPARAGPLELPGLSTQLELADVPTFLTANDKHHPSMRNLLMNQFEGLKTVDHVLVNSFYDLEPQEAAYLASTLGAKTIGPTVPSAYLDNGLPDDVSYDFNLHPPMSAESKAWLDAHPARSVVYASFGSVVAPGSDQMAEVAEGLFGSGKPFLWVVRATETAKLPAGFADKAAARGDLIVPWCPQLEVLAHPAVGCFVTHCGWNSTVETLSSGVPIVAVPQWSDQPMNAKYIQDVWRVGVRVRPDGEGVVRKEEVERCVREVMEGEMSREYRRRAAGWREKAIKAVSKGGTSDSNIAEFISMYRGHGRGQAKCSAEESGLDHVHGNDEAKSPLDEASELDHVPGNDGAKSPLHEASELDHVPGNDEAITPLEVSGLDHDSGNGEVKSPPEASGLDHVRANDNEAKSLPEASGLENVHGYDEVKPPPEASGSDHGHGQGNTHVDGPSSPTGTERELSPVREQPSKSDKKRKQSRAKANQVVPTGEDMIREIATDDSENNGVNKKPRTSSRLRARKIPGTP